MVKPRECVVERQAGIATQTENVLYAGQLQHAHEGYGAVYVRHVELTKQQVM